MRVRTVATVCCLAAALAGCGGSSDGTPAPASPSASVGTSAAQYKQDLASVSKQADQTQKLVQKVFHAETVDAVTSGLAAYAKAQQELSDRLAGLHPPADAVAANAQLAKGFADVSAALRDLLPKLAKAKTAKAALSEIQHAKGPQQVGREIDAALQKLKALGYTTGS